MKIIKVKNYKEMSGKAAEIIISEIKKEPNLVLGCATGKTCVGLYKELVKAYKKKKVDFSKVRTFNLDEYYPLKKGDKRSMHSYMHKNFFDKINIKKENINLLNSEAKNSKKETLRYEKKLAKNKIDLQILGLGVDGHIGYNEPGSSFQSKTRLIELQEVTLKSKFKNKKPPSTKALTMGIKNILNAKKIILLANGKHKRNAIKGLVKEGFRKNCPASVLKKHDDFTIISDKKAMDKVKPNENVLEKAYDEAVETLKECSTKYGLYASGGVKGYKGIWSRDVNISLIGGSTDGELGFEDQWKKSLKILKNLQSALGQIPNAVLNLNKKKKQVDFKSIDSNLWFVIGHYFYKKRYKNKNLFNKHKESMKRAVEWLHYRDFGENIELEQLPTTDWQDAFPHKYGATINTQALYYGMLKLVRDKRRAKKLKKIVNESKDDKLWNGSFYWAYRWKNHNKYKEIGDWFDSLGNLLAIIFELADRKKANSILNFIKNHHLARPYPMRCISPPIKPGSEFWEDYYYDAKATPNHYLNGGIWPFIGSFYVLALIKMKRFEEAEHELKVLAKSNLKGNFFPEWIDPITEETHGKLQAWSAGTYIWAYNSLKKKKVL